MTSKRPSRPQTGTQPKPARDGPTRADPPAASDIRLREGVRSQRRHIERLTGQDPLRGGIDD